MLLIKAYLLLVYISFMVNGEAVCYDTNFIEERYTSLKSSDKEIKHVRRESYCKTHCAVNSSCAAYSYNTETSTCFLSSEAKVVLSDQPDKSVSVKMAFKNKLVIDYENITPPSIVTTVEITADATTAETTEAEGIPADATLAEATSIEDFTVEATTLQSNTEDEATIHANDTTTEACPVVRDEQGNCFFTTKTLKNWFKSRQECQAQNKNADLAVFKSLEERSSIETIMQKEGIEFAWIGAFQTEAKVANFTWIDGSTLPISDTDFWATSNGYAEPNATSNNKRQCVAVKTRNSILEGYDQKCFADVFFAMCEL